MRRIVLVAVLALALPAAAAPALGLTVPPQDDPPRNVRAITSQGEVVLPAWGSLCWNYLYPATPVGGLCSDAPYLTPEILSTFPRLRVAEGERIRLELNAFASGLGAPSAVGLGVDPAPLEFGPLRSHPLPRSYPLPATDPTSWTAEGDDGLLTLTLSFRQGSPSYVARLEIVRPTPPPPPPGPPRAGDALCAEWNAKVAKATTRAVAAYRVAKTTRKPITRKRAYLVVSRLVKHRAGYLGLIAQGGCARR